ncbi:MAG: hypothetical protein JXA73_17740 [Acidobacteria bacterium]|nr:hypothetical protein [Acidobacteriota bacterium]
MWKESSAVFMQSFTSGKTGRLEIAGARNGFVPHLRRLANNASSNPGLTAGAYDSLGNPPPQLTIYDMSV